MDVEYDDHDPWNEPSRRHPRARQLVDDEALWDCANELAPFGSDEGADAYAEYRRWRSENPRCNLIECLAWILGAKTGEYNTALVSDSAIGDRDDSARDFGYPDAFTLDATIIATVLGQLVDEGRIDPEAKPIAMVAVDRQSHPSVLSQYRDGATIDERRAILHSVRRIIDAA
jgi:uncharacterized protein YfeS